MSNRTKFTSIPKTITASTTFLPTSITGCSLWLDGADATTLIQVGGTVSQWSDKSGNARHITQSTTGNQPTYSSTSNAVVFTGSQYLNIPTALAATTPVYNIFVVERRASANVMFFIGGYGVGSGNTALILGYNATNVSHHTTANITDCQVTIPSYAGASEPTKLNRYTYTGSTRSTSINGGSLSTSQSFSATLTTWTNPNVGIGFGTTYGYIGNIYEIIFYNATLTATQQQTIEGYLAQKWGLTASLPAGHLGLTTSIYQYLATVPVPITTTTTTTFLPTSIAGCQLWLDAADQTTITGTTTMTSWRDKSTNAYTANSFINSVAYPSWVSNLQNGNGAVQYSAGNGTSIANFVLSQTMSIFMVYYMINSTNGLFLEHGPDENVTSGFYFYPPGGNNFAINSGTGQVGVNFGNVVIANTWQMIQGINPDPSNSNTMAFYFNGTVKASGATQSGTTTVTKTLYINGRGGANSVSYNAYLGELIIFNTALSATNRQTIESYLAQKWAMTASLPVGHPGLTTPVYTITIAVPRQKIRTIPRAATFTNFVPTSITGCSLWLDAADSSSITGTTTVTAWADKSGLGNSPTFGTNKPSFIGNYIDTANSNVDFIIPISTINRISGQGGVLFFVFADKQTNSNYPALFSDGTPLNRFYQILLNSYGYEVGGNKLSQTGLNAMNTTNFIIYAFSYITGSSIVVRVNGSEILSSSSYAPNPSGQIYIGKDGWGDGTGNLKLNEILFYKNTLTTTQIQTVESYLAQKWVLTSSLVAGHPGLTTTVYGTVAAAPTVRQKIRALPPPAPLVSYTQTFAYTGANQTFTVPSRTTSITVYMWGAGGGGNTNYGGAGAMVQGVLSVTPGETLTIVVGQGGTIDGTTTFGGGGAGGGNMTGTPPTVGIGFSHNGFPQNAGSGGGRSAIQRGGTDPTNDIVVAGGGGGGTYFSSDRGGSATFSGTANAGVGGLPGLGGTQSAGGAGGGTGQYGQGLSGSRGVGGDTYNNNYYNGGGGGGGGYYGGGGGGTNGGDGAGGGGGSSLTSTLSLISGQSVLGFNSTNGYTAPNNTSPYYVSGVGNGAPAINSNPRAGDNGRVVLVYMA